MFVLRTLADWSESRESPDCRSGTRLLRLIVRNTNNGMSPYIHPRLRGLLSVVGALEEVSRELAKEARKRIDERRPRPKRGATLKPSSETPLWNAIITLVKPQLSRRGARAVLARELNVHRARIGEYFDQQTAMPDAERALELLIWVSRKYDTTKTQS